MRTEPIHPLPRRPGSKSAPAVFLTAALLAATAAAQPVVVLDIATASLTSGTLQRVRGSAGFGSHGVPVAGGFDMDGDLFADYAIAFMRASPTLNEAGEIDLVFGDGAIHGEIDTAVDQERLLRIFGSEANENAGSEIWMDDVTGDGLGDLLVCRQNYGQTIGRSGAGALTIIVGGPELRTFAQGLQPLNLSSPPAELTVTTVLGAGQGDRLCIWARTGDVTGDTIADVVVGADQQSIGGTHAGAIYVLMGGGHLAAGGNLDLANLSAAALRGRVAHVVAPVGSSHSHLGATCQVADLDGNGTAEVLAAATLNRAGAGLQPSGPSTSHGSGGVPDGALYVLWDDNFTSPWSDVFVFDVLTPPGSLSILLGADANINFGEEILGGLDYDDDGMADLFVGDLTGDGTASKNRPVSGVGYVFYEAADLKGLQVDMDSPPPSVSFSTLLGPVISAIGADTAAHGDFDGDGIADLAFCSPHAAPQGRINAGAIHVLRGRSGGWPDLIDTASLPSPSLVHIGEIQGALGRLGGGDQGDTLCYSAAAGDVDGDGATDLIVNEMTGNGTSVNDVGNLLLIDGRAVFSLFRDGFESGGTTAWTLAVP